MIFKSFHLGVLEVQESSIIDFPAGIPGFEELRKFAVLTRPDQPALVFLQSLEAPAVCLLSVPVRVLRPEYSPAISEEDLELLRLPPGAVPEIGSDVAALAVLSLVEGEPPTANLLAPIVIHLAERRAVQAIRPDGLYDCREPLEAPEPVCL